MIQARALIGKLTAGLLGLLACWALLAPLALYRTHKAKTEATDFSRDFMKLQVQKSGLDEITSLVRKYDGKWRNHTVTAPGSPCGGGASVADFVFDNAWLHWFFLAPRTQFSATVYVKSDRVCFRSLGIWDTVHGFTGVGIEEFAESLPLGSFRSSLMLPKAIIVMDIRAPAEARAAAYSLNLNCLAKLRGCQDAREMAPAIWQNSHEIGPTLRKSQWEN